MSDTERYLYGSGPIEINADRPTITMTVHNTGDRAVQVGSHYHFFEVNRALSFDRDKAFGKHLDVPAGTAVRFEPGDTRRVDLVEYGGGLRIVGFSGLLNGGVRSQRSHANALARLAELGFKDEPGSSGTSSGGTTRDSATKRKGNA